MPTVSVIIPTYNRALKLKEAIQSVLDQTYTDYEVIVVDDGSVDNTREVVNELKQHSDKLVYVYQENRGRSAARNYGISLAKGDYIAFLDSDDRFLPEKLSVQVKALENNGDFAMAYSTLIFMGENGAILGSSDKARTRLSGWIYPELLFIKGAIIITSGVMVRASVLSEIGGFDEEMHICEDLDLWRRIAKRYKVLQIEQPLSIYAYRLNDQPDVLENVKARSFYYQKAIAEDPALEKSIQSKLFLEMYSQYGAVALFERNIPLAFSLLVQSAKTDPFRFLFVFFGHVVGYSYYYVGSRLLSLWRRYLPHEPSTK